MEVDIPEVKKEVEAAFALYETALVTNDVATSRSAVSQRLAHVTLRNCREPLWNDAIREFRRNRSPQGLIRKLDRTIITTYGRDFATANTLFYRDSAPGKVGRQSQTWVRFDDGWHIVAAHVSIIDTPMT